jgi:hypothetical protein
MSSRIEQIGTGKFRRHALSQNPAWSIKAERAPKRYAVCITRSGWQFAGNGVRYATNNSATDAERY